MSARKKSRSANASRRAQIAILKIVMMPTIQGKMMSRTNASHSCQSSTFTIMTGLKSCIPAALFWRTRNQLKFQYRLRQHLPGEPHSTPQRCSGSPLWFWLLLSDPAGITRRNVLFSGFCGNPGLCSEASFCALSDSVYRCKCLC